jgi:hypothetical protein
VPHFKPNHLEIVDRIAWLWLNGTSIYCTPYCTADLWGGREANSAELVPELPREGKKLQYASPLPAISFPGSNT